MYRGLVFAVRSTGPLCASDQNGCHITQPSFSRHDEPRHVMSALLQLGGYTIGAKPDRETHPRLLVTCAICCTTWMV